LCSAPRMPRVNSVLHAEQKDCTTKMTQGANEADSELRKHCTVQVPRGEWSFYPVTNKCNRATRAETSARNEQHDDPLASCNTRSASLAVSTQTDHKPIPTCPSHLACWTCPRQVRLRPVRSGWPGQCTAPQCDSKLKHTPHRNVEFTPCNFIEQTQLHG
jgi:hypothetical protein